MRGYEQNTRSAEALPGLELHNIIEGMSSEAREAYKDRLLSEISDREHLVFLINETEKSNATKVI